MGLNFYLCPDEKTFKDTAVCKAILALRCLKYPVQHPFNLVLAGVVHPVHPGAEYAFSKSEGTARSSLYGLLASAFI